MHFSKKTYASLAKQDFSYFQIPARVSVETDKSLFLKDATTETFSMATAVTQDASESPYVEMASWNLHLNLVTKVLETVSLVRHAQIFANFQQLIG